MTTHQVNKMDSNIQISVIKTERKYQERKGLAGSQNNQTEKGQKFNNLLKVITSL